MEGEGGKNGSVLTAGRRSAPLLDYYLLLHVSIDLQDEVRQFSQTKVCHPTRCRPACITTRANTLTASLSTSPFQALSVVMEHTPTTGRSTTPKGQATTKQFLRLGLHLHIFLQSMIIYRNKSTGVKPELQTNVHSLYLSRTASHADKYAGGGIRTSKPPQTPPDLFASKACKTKQGADSLRNNYTPASLPALAREAVQLQPWPLRGHRS